MAKQLSYKSMKEKNLRIIYYLSAFLVGAVISVMVVFNTSLGIATNNSISIAINQITGIVVLTLIMLAFPHNKTVNPERKPAHWWQWFGGLFGLMVISINYFSVKEAGTTIAMASAVLGQCVMGLIYDVSGFMGMEKRKVGMRKIISLLISLLGIAIMLLFPGSSNSRSSFIFAFLSVISGVLTMIQMVYNSSFAKAKGSFFSARQNVISGLCGILLFMLIFNLKPSIEAAKGLAAYPIWKTLMGGTLAVIVVVASNLIIPKIPGAASSILMSAGQILTAVLLDYLMYSISSPSLIAGAFIMILGLALAP